MHVEFCLEETNSFYKDSENDSFLRSVTGVIGKAVTNRHSVNLSLGNWAGRN